MKKTDRQIELLELMEQDVEGLSLAETRAWTLGIVKTADRQIVHIRKELGRRGAS